MTAPPANNPSSQLIQLFTDFLTCAIHTILFHRRIYSSSLFLSARKYNSLVRQCRHPDLCKWISDAVDTVQEQLLANALLRVSLVILAPVGMGEKPLERFVFDTRKFPRMGDVEVDEEEKVSLEEQFRVVLEKVGIGSMGLAGLPEECSFTICLEVRDEQRPEELGRWDDAGPSSSRNKSRNPTSTPLRSIRIGPGDHCIDVWVEESRAKKQLATIIPSTPALSIDYFPPTA